MKVKLKHEFEMILLEVLERRGGCMDILKLVVLLVFSSSPCSSYHVSHLKQRNILISMILQILKMVSSPNK
jgi:hypothetical protein